MRAVMIVVGVIIILLLFGTMLTGIQTAQTDERTDAFTSVVTGVGESEADVVLVADPYDDNILNVIEITSTLGTDAPLADSYVTSTNTLTVRGLTASQTRTLDVLYRYDAMTGDASMVSNLMGYIPLFVVMAIVIILIGGGWAVWQRVRG